MAKKKCGKTGSTLQGEGQHIEYTKLSKILAIAGWIIIGLYFLIYRQIRVQVSDSQASNIAGHDPTRKLIKLDINKDEERSQSRMSLQRVEEYYQVIISELSRSRSLFATLSAGMGQVLYSH